MTASDHGTPDLPGAGQVRDPGRAADRGRARGHRRGGRRRRQDLITRVAGDALSVRRAFGEPIQHGDVMLVPVAKVMGGTGSGYGTGEMGGDQRATTGGPAGSGSGGGGGFGVRVKPLGVFVVEGSSVQWRPALDLNRIILGGQLVGAVAVLAVAHTLRRRHFWRR